MDINKIVTNSVDTISQAGITGSKNKTDLNNSEQTKLNGNLELTRENINDLVDVLNSAAKSVNQRVSFSFHEKSNRVIMKVIDPGTNEVVREIPPKEMIRLLEHMHELIGVVVDESR